MRVPFARSAARSAAAMPSATPTFPPLTGPPAAVDAVRTLSAQYDELHAAYETCFWETKMNLKGASADALAASKTALEAWLASPDNAALAKRAAAEPGVDGDTAAALAAFQAAFAVYAAPPAAAPLRERLNKLEADLAAERRAMRLGYVDPASDGGAFVEASVVQLRTLMRTSPDEATRRAAYEGMRSIGPFVVSRLCDIVKARNALAAASGDYEDFYDMKVRASEGMSKAALFAILDDLERRTRPLAERAAAALRAAKGDAAWAPWNRPAALSGDTDRALDPYFQFRDAVGVWARSFAALGVSYRGGTITLDLLDRPGKYSNGFCHWPRVAYVDAAGVRHAAAANLTSLADPRAVGSGRAALATLAHECGHAAHFAGCEVRAPVAAQERAPTSVALAETQSMFLDSFVDDAAWLARYARDAGGAPVPWPLVEAKLRSGHPYAVLAVRAMLAVPMFERRLYELPPEDVTPENVLALADAVEAAIELGPSPRPLLSVPHPLADESAAYYHAYVLAEMAVHQTRAALARRLGPLVDNAAVGPALHDGYWRHGNTKPYADMVADVTGAPLSAAAWVAELETPVDAKVRAERAAYDAAAAAGPALPPGADAGAALDVRVVIAHGDETVADSAADGGLAAAEAKFRAWLDARAKAEEGG